MPKTSEEIPIELKKLIENLIYINSCGDQEAINAISSLTEAMMR